MRIIGGIGLPTQDVNALLDDLNDIVRSGADTV